MTSVRISPEEARFDQAVTLSFDFTSDKEVGGCHWEVSYLVDYTSARHVIKVAATEPSELKKGENKVELQVPAMDVTSIDAKLLRNVGLLRATLVDSEKAKSGAEEEAEILQVGMVTLMEPKSDAPGGVVRVITNPLE